MLFDSRYSYPHDGTGEYVDLEGTVTRVGEPLSDSVSVTVQTPEGEFTGYERLPHCPKLGYIARVRIYRCGGGFYPDNRIVGWRAPPEPERPTIWQRLGEP